jgi:hypothetical protein
MALARTFRSPRGAAEPRPGFETPGYEDEVPPGLKTGGWNDSATASDAAIASAPLSGRLAGGCSTSGGLQAERPCQQAGGYWPMPRE